MCLCVGFSSKHVMFLLYCFLSSKKCHLNGYWEHLEQWLLVATSALHKHLTLRNKILLLSSIYLFERVLYSVAK